MDEVISQALVFIGGAVVALFGGKKIMQVDSRVESKKIDAIDLAVWANSNGLPVLSGLLKAFIVNDFTGMIREFRSLVAIIRNEKDAAKVMKDFLNVQMDNQLSTVEGADALIKMIEHKLCIKIDREAVTPKVVKLTEGEINDEGPIA